jgi:hypothetical protein
MFNKGGTIALKKEGTRKMAEILCENCNCRRLLMYNPIQRASGDKADSFYGVLTCRRCGQKTIFGMNDDAVSFYPSKKAYGALSENTPQNVRDMFTDAELCFYGMGFRGAVSVSRACVEAGLTHKGITKGKLEERIDEAKSIGILTETEYMLAHGSRLAGNAALHKAQNIAPSDVPVVLSAVASIINHLFPQETG